MSSLQLQRPASPADSLRSFHIENPLESAEKVMRETCLAVCIADRSVNRRDTFYYQLGKKIGWCS